MDWPTAEDVDEYADEQERQQELEDARDPVAAEARKQAEARKESIRLFHEQRSHARRERALQMLAQDHQEPEFAQEGLEEQERSAQAAVDEAAREAKEAWDEAFDPTKAPPYFPKNPPHAYPDQFHKSGRIAPMRGLYTPDQYEILVEWFQDNADKTLTMEEKRKGYEVLRQRTGLGLTQITEQMRVWKGQKEAWPELQRQKWIEKRRREARVRLGLKVAEDVRALRLVRHVGRHLVDE